MQRAQIYDILLTDGPRGTRGRVESAQRWDGGLVSVAYRRGCAVIDKSFVIMALACAAAPVVGAGIYIVVYLF